MHLLSQNTILYHGTSEDFEPSDIRNGSWFTTSLSVAEHFARRFPSDDGCKIHVFILNESVELPDFYSRTDMEEYLEEQGIFGVCNEEIVEAIVSQNLPGWIIPYNYPDGDDILLQDTSKVEWIESRKID
jgi:hypothetical protein